MPEDEAIPELVDTARLVQRAIDSVLDKAPPAAGADPPGGPDEAKVQPWAETAAPAGKNKRPLEELLAIFAGRIAAAPEAVAAAPSEQRPAESFFERLTRRDGGGGGGGGGGRPGRGRRRRARPGRPQQPQPQSQTPRQAQQPPPGERPAGTGTGPRRRRGRRRRR